MHHLMNLFGEFWSKFGKVSRGAPLVRMAVLLVAGAVFMAVQPGLGDENDGPARSATSARPASQRAASPDSANPAPTKRPENEDHVRHYGALGVLLSKSDDGVTVVGVLPGSAAARAGLRLGDEIRFVGDDRIHTIPELTEKIGGYEPGTNVELLIRRNGKRQVVDANLGERETVPDRGDRSDDNAGKPAAAAPRARALTGRPRAPVAAPATGQIRDRQMSQRMRDLERQIYRLHQDLNDLRHSHATHAANTYDVNAWWDRQHHGEADDDPSLFQ